MAPPAGFPASHRPGRSEYKNARGPNRAPADRRSVRAPLQAYGGAASYEPAAPVAESG